MFGNRAFNAPSNLRDDNILKKKGFLLCVEGIDKSGKTLQSKLLVKALARRGHNVVYTTEPSNGTIGRFIRRNVLQRKRRISIVVEALLFAADRAEHTESEIKPLLKEGNIVVCDRYIYSSLAYQGAAGLDSEWIKSINVQALNPDLVIYLDIPVRVVLKRYRHTRSAMEWPSIQRKVKKAYLRFVRNGDMIPIDGNRTIDKVAKDILVLVLGKLGH